MRQSIRKWFLHFAFVVMVAVAGLNAKAEDTNTCQLTREDLQDSVFAFGGFGDSEISYYMPNIRGYGYLAANDDYERAKTTLTAKLKSGTYKMDMTGYHLTSEDVSKMMTEILNENPLLTIDYQSCGWSCNWDGIVVGDFCVYYKAGADQRRAEVKNKAYQILNGFDYSTLEDVEIALYLHDYLVSHARYAYREYLDNTLDQIPDVYNAYGALVDGYCVCQGYAEGYQLLLSLIGIPCKVIASGKMFHAWNLVYVDDQWYHVDATWDDPVWDTPGNVGHRHFLASDAKMLNELGHYGWTEGISCTSTAYDGAWWNTLYGRIDYRDGKAYYLKNNPNGTYTVIERTNAVEKPVKTVNEYTISAGGGSYYPMSPRLSLVGGRIYWNDATKIYTQALSGEGPVNEVFTLPAGQIFKSFVLWEDGTLNYQSHTEGTIYNYNDESFESALLTLSTNLHTHVAREDDGDCTTPVLCQYCTEVVIPGKEKHRVEDDKDCTTALVCLDCGKVLDPAKSAHEAREDDGDCTTAVYCKYCDTLVVAAEKEHKGGDGDCTTDDYCEKCGKLLAAARKAHAPIPDDGDCTTPVICYYCSKVVTPARKAHEPEADDGDCTTSVQCKYCDKMAIQGYDYHDIVEETGVEGNYSYVRKKCSRCSYCQGTEYKEIVSGIEKDAVKDFCARMYTVALGRDYDEAGLTDWTNKLKQHKIDGAGIAYGFLMSQEFINKNLNDQDFVDVLYHTFFDREPDQGGRDMWLSKLAQGANRNFVIGGFVNSQEFTNLCDKFGIIRGNYDSGEEFTGVRGFVLRLYTKVLGREGEADGVNDWINRIETRSTTPEQAAMDFFNSQEFLQKGLGNEDYVETLYQTFMGRASDEGGKADWVGRLNQGTDRNTVLQGFSRSEEFGKIMQSFGL